MELQKTKQWVTSLNVPTALMFTLSVITVVFTIIVARSSGTVPIPDTPAENQGSV